MRDETMLPLGILLLGAVAIMAFIAARPWPVTPSSKPIKPGAYVIEILQGQPPAASAPVDRQGQISEIENGLTAVLLIWAASKVASGVSGIVGSILGALGTLAKGAGDVAAEGA